MLMILHRLGSFSVGTIRVDHFEIVFPVDLLNELLRLQHVLLQLTHHFFFTFPRPLKLVHLQSTEVLGQILILVMICVVFTIEFVV